MTVGFESLVYRVTESAGAVEVRLALSGETSNTVTVALVTTDQNTEQGCARNYLKELLLQRQIKGWGYQLIGDL